MEKGLEEKIEQARKCLERAQAVAVLTGAGISAESGISTFRGPGGLWKKYNPMTLATPEAFARDPALVWEWYNWRRSIMAKAEPNPGHSALVSLEKRLEGRGNFTLITQNIDGLHEKAGSRNMLELHGNIWRIRCTRCGRVEEDFREEVPYPPMSACCGALQRPHVVWFGESLDPFVLSRAEESSENCQVLLVVGTSGTVHPAASLALRAAARGAVFLEMNPDPTPLSPYARVSLQGKAGEILPRIVQS